MIIAGAPFVLLGRRARPRTRCAIPGGLNGDSWLTALTGDLGHGIFDGAALVQNFENMNPSNTLWGKQYELYARSTPRPALSRLRGNGGRIPPSSTPRRCSGSSTTCSSATSWPRPRSSPATRSRSTCATSPRRSSASAPRATTSPPAAGAGLDPRPLRRRPRHPRQLAVDHRLLHSESIGHLGVFVSGSVATKEHQEFRHQHRLHRLPAARPL